MSCPKECPICMDDIMEINFVITECGHSFHTSCLMKNAAHNGFGCPYCRAVMAEVPEEEDEEDDYSSSEEEEDDDEPFSDYSLRGMRWLFLRSNNLPIEEEDEDEELEEDNELPAPSSEFIALKLVEQNITIDDLVKCLLVLNHQEYEEKEEFQNKEDEIFDKMQLIINNYRNPLEPEPINALEEPFIEEEKEDDKEEKEEKEEIIEESIPIIDYSAQPKEKVKINYLKNRIIY